ncbi:UNVERIFIED_CONTAM: hypothetical protein Sangu_3253400 [Sesamum angustifolium]|uniref:Uncharacterized protein n=1 Tax=Sesamum angustifolium TaxID=2727405 RepID=A0AAW2JDW6_9LAMI
MYRVPSELQSQACLGESSSTMGDPLGSPRVAPLFANLSSYLSSHQLFLFFFFLRTLPPATALYMRFQSSWAGSGSVGPTERVRPTELNGRPKMGRNAAEMAEYWR